MGMSQLALIMYWDVEGWVVSRSLVFWASLHFDGLPFSNLYWRFRWA